MFEIGIGTSVFALTHPFDNDGPSNRQLLAKF